MDEFLKRTLVLKGTDHELDDTSTVMILMNSIPDSYQVVKDAFQYSGTVPSYDLLCSALKTREMELKTQKSKSGTNLFVKNKSGNGNNKNKKAKEKSSKNQSETRKCYHCGKAGHLRKDCFKWLEKNKNNTNPETNVASSSNPVIESSEVLNVSENTGFDNWALDTSCTFHMCLHSDWFVD
ncbi:MAG: hypothetical protein EOO38_15735, partial [Cytophagaceae bacterium]